MSVTTALTIKSQEPLNAGTPVATLGQDFITPSEQFFIRSHGNIPAVNPASYHLTVDGLVDQPLSLTLAELQARFTPVEVTATLQCAGNRRAELHTIKPINGEVQWDIDGISTGVWTGFRLADLLGEAGLRLQSDTNHVLFDGLDTVEREGHSFGYGGSIPLVKALNPEVLLAYKLNGQPLTAEHGFPLRVVVPGYIGARSVKWLNHIRVAEQPSTNFFQTKAYKLFPPQVSAAEADWLKAEALGAVRINSVITNPLPDAVLPANQPFTIEGYAIGAENTSVASVEVSLDEGQAWQSTELVTPCRDPWTWQLWKITLTLPPGNYGLVVRAADSANNRQPADFGAVWNFKGYMNNAWQRININVRMPTA